MQTFYLKTKAGIFDTFLFKKIKRANYNGENKRDLLISVWFELLELSLRNDEIGVINNDASYLSKILERSEKEIVYCLNFYFDNFMIETSEKGIKIKNFGIDKNNLYILNQEEGRTSKEYRVWRLSVLERDDFKCKMCGVKEKIMHAHHIIRWADSIENRFNISNGVCLCKNCHKKIHKGEKSLCRNE